MSQTVFLPLTFAAFTQEPKTGAEAPAPTTGGAAPTGQAPNPAAGTTQPPAAAAPAGPCGGPETLIYMGVFLALMYFMVMRPEQKRRKETQALLSSVKKGDRVVTIGGMHGKVTGLSEKTLTLSVDTVQMTFDRSAIARVERDDAVSPAPKG